MIRTSAAICFCCSAIVFLIQAAEGQNASNPNSVVDYYQNLFHGRPAAGVSAATGIAFDSTESVGQMNLNRPSGVKSATLVANVDLEGRSTRAKT